MLVSFLPLRESYSSHYYVVKHHQSDSCLNVCEEVLYLYKNMYNYDFVCLILMSSDRWKDKGSQVNGSRHSPNVFQS